MTFQSCRGAKAWREDSAGFSLVELMAYMAIIVAMAAFVLPFTRTTLRALDLSNDARNLSSATGQAKMRAASHFTQSRVFVSLGGGTYHVERWQKNPAQWVAEGPVMALSPTTSFGFGGLSTPPPNTQAVIGQATPCLDALGAAVAGSACIVFNSRGVPVDSTNAPTGGGALYISNGTSVFGLTATAGGMVQLWRAHLVDGVWNRY